MKYENMDVSLIKLDFENPRISHYISFYKDPSSEELSLALTGSSAADASSKYRALKTSIMDNGGIFTPIIVDHNTSTDEYTVIEGNTRLKFYQEFYEKDHLEKWKKIPCIVYDDMSSDEKHKIRLQAHMVGARDWDAFSKAKYLDYLYNVEQKSMTFLKSFCGSSENTIRQLIDAYADMNDFYVNKYGSDASASYFSYYMELQKGMIKDILVAHGYGIDDFTEWMISEKIDRAESVRQLGKVLDNPVTRPIFMKEGLNEAIKHLDAENSELKKIEKINMYGLAKELLIKLRKIELAEVINLRENDKYLDYKEILIDLNDQLSFVIDNIGDPDE